MEDRSERRLVENEVMFRAINQRVGKTAASIMKQLPMEDVELQFYCECSNAACTARLRLSVREYEKIHEISNHFIVRPGHDIPEIERTIGSGDGFIVVEKIPGVAGDSLRKEE